MADEKANTIKIDLPEGSIEATGSARFLDQVRAALVPVLSGQPLSVPAHQGDQPSAAQLVPGTPNVPTLTRLPTIRDLYGEKRPATDSQTAALIAYYLSELASPDERMEVVDSETMIRYFKLCPRDLPQTKGQILPNAKRDGYLDSTKERGKYKLNAIGYNLVVHGLPASPSASQSRTSLRKKVSRHKVPKRKR